MLSDTLTSTKFYKITKDLPDSVLIEAAEEYDHDHIAEDGYIREWTLEVIGREDLAAMMLISTLLAMTLAERLRRSNHSLSNIKTTLLDLATEKS
jgi:hypothetical protein